MNKVVFLKSYFVPVGENKVVKVPTGEKKKGFLGGESDVTKDERKWVQTGFSDCIIDSGRLTKDLEEAVIKLNKEGYEVVSVTAVTSGNYSWQKYSTHSATADTAVSWGYSYTDGLMVVARKV